MLIIMIIVIMIMVKIEQNNVKWSTIKPDLISILNACLPCVHNYSNPSPNIDPKITTLSDSRTNVFRYTHLNS